MALFCLDLSVSFIIIHSEHFQKSYCPVCFDLRAFKKTYGPGCMDLSVSSAIFHSDQFKKSYDPVSFDLSASSIIFHSDHFKKKLWACLL